MPKNNGPTPKQRKFIEAFLETWNATEAARQADYAQPEKQGWRIRHSPAIAAAINERISKSAMPADEVLARLAQQARANIADFVEENNSKFVLNFEEIRKRGYLVKAVRSTRYGPAIELYDAQGALALIGKHLGMFVDRHELSGTNGDAIHLEVDADAIISKLLSDAAD